MGTFVLFVKQVCDTCKEFMTINEAAKEMEVSHWTIRRWINQRKFPVTKINSKVIRIRKDDLEKFRKKHTVKEWDI